MKTRYFMNKRNNNKRLMVNEYKCGHISVLPFMAWNNGVINKLGDGNLHRWKKKDLAVLLVDYEEIV